MTEKQDQEQWPVWATEPVEIVDPDPAWITRGLHMAQQLGNWLSPYGVLEIEHVGSTSIPNLPAKPVVDLMAKITSFQELPAIVDVLEKNSWFYVPPELDGRAWRRFFVNVQKDKRAGHLHLMLEHEEHWDMQLRFRDKLREQPQRVMQYAELKRKLAAQNPDDREAYTAAKTNFVMSILHGE